MENVSKALEMAAGVLVAVLIMSLVAYFFSSIGKLPEQEDEVKTKAQLEAFNKEYEVYSKKGMYGVDVISCLNKAINNNEKYVEGNAFLTGQSYGKDYKIDVCFNIKSPLTESIEPRYFDKNKNEIISFDEEIDGYTLKDVGFFTESLTSDNSYTSFKETDKLGKKESILDSKGYIIASGGSKNYAVDGNSKQYYSLLDHNDQPLILRLLKFSNMLKIEVRNRSDKDLDKWSSAIWKTALYDFKTKRFKCDDIRYSDKTGRVNEIYFSEID